MCCNKVKRLLRKIENCKTTDYLDKEHKIKLIIGIDSYPDKSNIKASGLWFYDEYKIEEIAFLTYNKNLDLVSIMGILLNSVDDAAKLIDELVKRKMMERLAIFLHNKHIILINQNKNARNLSNVCDDYKNIEVLYVGSQGNVKYQNEIKSFLKVPHPSPKNYASKKINKECYETYFEHSYPGKEGSNLTLKAFKIKY